MGLLDVRFLVKTVEELWRCGYADHHDWPILQDTNVRFMDVQDASSYGASQGKKCVFVCTFVHSDGVRVPAVSKILFKSVLAETQPAAFLANRERQGVGVVVQPAC